MKKLGYTLIAVGFLAGSVISAVDKTQVNWLNYSMAFAVCFAGVAVARYSIYRHKSSDDTISQNMQNVYSSMEKIVENTKKLSEMNFSENPRKIVGVIDELFPENINAFVDSRESISNLFGLQAYADVMSHFAAGERYMNRVWSAAADGYINEAETYIEKMKEQFDDASNMLYKLKKNQES